MITALIIYQLRIHKAENRLERDLAGIERQLHHNLIPQSPVAHQLSPEEVAARQEAARRQAEKEDSQQSTREPQLKSGGRKVPGPSTSPRHSAACFQNLSAW